MPLLIYNSFCSIIYYTVDALVLDIR